MMCTNMKIYAPEVRDFVYISDKAYNRDQILGMEKLMLNTLKFTLTVPTAFHFMSRYLKAAGGDKQMELVASFLVRPKTSPDENPPSPLICDVAPNSEINETN